MVLLAVSLIELVPKQMLDHLYVPLYLAYKAPAYKVTHPTQIKK